MFAKAFLFVCHVIFCANEITHLRVGKQAVDIVVVPYKFGRIVISIPLPAKFFGYGTEFFDEGVSGMVTANIDRSVILDLNSALYYVVI